MWLLLVKKGGRREESKNRSLHFGIFSALSSVMPILQMQKTKGPTLRDSFIYEVIKMCNKYCWQKKIEVLQILTSAGRGCKRKNEMYNGNYGVSLWVDLHMKGLSRSLRCTFVGKSQMNTWISPIFPEQTFQVDNKNYFKRPCSEKSHHRLFSWIWGSNRRYTYNF